MGNIGRAYNTINLTFIIVILFIVIYSFLFRGTTHPVPALLSDVTGLMPPSKGLSSSFSEIVRGNFTEARFYNAYGIQIFAFFIIQLMLRVLTSIVIKGNWVKPSKLMVMDIVFSVMLFSLCFAPLIAYTLKLFAEFF